MPKHAEAPTLGEIAEQLQEMKDAGVTWESLIYVADKKVWWDRDLEPQS